MFIVLFISSYIFICNVKFIFIENRATRMYEKWFWHQFSQKYCIKLTKGNLHWDSIFRTDTSNWQSQATNQHINYYERKSKKITNFSINRFNESAQLVDNYLCDWWINSTVFKLTVDSFIFWWCWFNIHLVLFFAAAVCV